MMDSHRPQIDGNRARRRHDRRRDLAADEPAAASARLGPATLMAATTSPVVADRRGDAAHALLALLFVEGVPRCAHRASSFSRRFADVIVRGVEAANFCVAASRTSASGRYASSVLPRPVQYAGRMAPARERM